MRDVGVQANVRRWVIAPIATVAVLIIAGLGWTVATGDNGPRVSSGNGSPDRYALVLRVDDGRAGHVAVSSNSDVVKVWWQGADDDSWSAPEIIDGGRGRYLVWTNTRLAGTTLAIRAHYNTHAPWDDEVSEPGVASSVFIACQPTSCEVSDHYEHVQEPPCRHGSCIDSRPRTKGVTQVPELSADGSQVYFGSAERGYVAWDADEGMHELQPQGIPTGGVLGTAMLAPDGSLRLVSGHAKGSECELTLLSTGPLTDSASEMSYTRQSETTLPTASGNCATTLEAFTSDQLLVHTDTDEPAYFVRSDDTWSPAAEDPTGMVRYPARPGRHAAGSVVRTGYWHWREVVTASPDGRRLVAQVHFPGTAEWTDPVTIAIAPPGMDCFEIAPTSTPADEPFYVSMRCRLRPSPDAPGVYVGVHAVTDDGLTWESAFGDDLPTRVGDDLYFGGSPAHRWTSDDGLVEVGLRVPDNSESFLLDDGTYVLVSAEPAGSRCRLEVRVAQEGDSDWSAPIPSEPLIVPDGDPCQPVGQYDGDVVSLYFRSHSPRWMPPRVVKRDGEWMVTAPRRAG